jgi:hypothetical protein
MRPKSARAYRALHESRNGAASTLEKTMRLLTYLELSRCTKPELCDLYCRALLAKSELPPGSPGHINALLNMRRIRVFMARPGCTPG